MNRPLLLLLALASMLRLVLVVHGGQLYWPDERLYTRVLDIFDLHRGHPFDVVKLLVSTQDHLGFALISAVPAAVQLSIGHALSRSGNGLMMLPGIALSQASVVSIALIYAIARRCGGDRREALLAAVLAASATTLFYYSRHLLPYDSSMMLALLALWFGVGTSRRDSVACGAAASAAFITYNGYWLLAAVIPLLHIAHEARTSVADAAKRAAWATLGFLLVPLLIIVVEVATGAPLLFAGMLRLAGKTSLTDGYSPEGFSLPWAYFWHAEHGVLLVWLAALLFVALDPAEWAPGRRRTATTWVVAAGVVYLGLGITSAVQHVFVVMGRQSRQLVPFLCLAGAAAAVELLERRRRSSWVVTACVSALVLQVAWNFREPLQQRFPRDLIAEVTSKYGAIDLEITLQGPPKPDTHVGSEWVLLNAEHLYHPRAARPPLPGALREVMRFPHPLQFLPYQYEGFGPMERQVLRGNDISMRLIDVGVPIDRLP